MKHYFIYVGADDEPFLEGFDKRDQSARLVELGDGDVLIPGLVEDDAPLGSAEEGLRRPEADVFPAAAEPVESIRTGLEVLKHDARRERASPGHQRVQCAESVSMEPTEAPRLAVLHPERRQVHLMRTTSGLASPTCSTGAATLVEATVAVANIKK
jgi:hypothetical protein